MQVAASGESMYDDAFTIQHVEKQYVDDFNYVGGMVPFLLNLIKDVSSCPWGAPCLWWSPGCHVFMSGHLYLASVCLLARPVSYQ